MTAFVKKTLLRISRNRSFSSLWQRFHPDHTIWRCMGARNLGTESNNNDDDEKWTEWIPPNRPLAGDKGQSHLYPIGEDDDNDDDDEERELKRLEEQLRALEEAEEAKQKQSVAPSGDWLQTRRAVLGEDTEALHMLPPDQAQTLRDTMGDIPVKKHTLLSKDEIASCLEALGGRDIKVILDLEKRRMDGSLGIVLVTVVTQSQLRVLADALVRQMRRRHLHEVNVVGAVLGPEGNSVDEGWWVVDCRNYVVHLQDETTRKALDLEGLWTGKDGLQHVNPLNEEEVEDYVAQNPIPEEYGRPSFQLEDTLKQLGKTRWTTSSRPAVSKRKNRRRRRKS